MNPNIDLRQLAIRRDAPGPAGDIRLRRHVWTRYVIPGLLLAGFLGLLAWALREALLPARPVTVVPVLATRAAVAQEAGTPLFQAAGWVEPRPTAVAVTALAEGVIEQLFVVENQEVKAGEKVAQLVEDDARLALRMAEAEKALKDAEVEALEASTKKELANLSFQTQAAEARERLAGLELERKTELFAGGAGSDLAVNRAKTELATAQAGLRELQIRQRNLEREAQALVEAARARQRVARVAVETAELRLKRMVVRAPLTGRVLGLVGRPGMRVMGQSAGAGPDASTVVTMYDPRSLQVRADVRFEDLPKVRPGQPVKVEAAALPGQAVEGEVLFTTSQADIQKNTLQVKVALKDPPAVLRPDMLVEATFLALPPAGTPSISAERVRLLVPRSLVDGDAKGGKVWVVDQEAGVARLRAVKLGPAAGTELVEVVEGLRPADRLIAGGREGLQDGQRVRVTGEDPAYGVAAPGAGPRPRPNEHAHPKH